MDHDKIQRAVRLLLEGIGENPAREGLQDTPKRIASMMEELFGGTQREPAEHFQTVFSAPDNKMIVEKDIAFYSVCEHHLLPFFGSVHVGYIPKGNVLGLSKIARVVEVYARRAQIQEQLTMQICEAFMQYLKPEGAIVLIEAEHLCMSMRGIRKPGAKTLTICTKGVFETDDAQKDNFLKMIGKAGL